MCVCVCTRVRVADVSLCVTSEKYKQSDVGGGELDYKAGGGGQRQVRVLFIDE